MLLSQNALSALAPLRPPPYFSICPIQPENSSRLTSRPRSPRANSSPSFSMVVSHTTRRSGGAGLAPFLLPPPDKPHLHLFFVYFLFFSHRPRGPSIKCCF